MYDQAFENSLWDYDPKFAWDYLPNTKRGTLEHKLQQFVMDQDYVHEEFKWHKWENNYNQLWRGFYMEKASAY